jgi:UDP-N-acetylglucosamine transferase subunit ALG13
LSNFNNKIIVAPLDWGLGHATRCVPIIAALIAKGYEPIIAGSTETIALLLQEFEHLSTVLLPSYNIAYKKVFGSHRLYLLWQVMRLKKIIKQEQEIIENYCTQNHITQVISDNRYGIYLKKGNNIFLTHQLQIATGFGAFADSILQKIHYRFLKPFSHIWVPDHESALQSLSGVLSHTKAPKIPVHFIGPLSRLQPQKTAEKKHHFAFIASGPEPYKSMFIQKAIALANVYAYPTLIIGGNVLHTNAPINLPSHITYIAHATASQMQQVINKSQYLISRSGYSSIMDAAATNATCIMLPTPGQTEQIYLANYLGKQKFIMALKELDMPLAELYKMANNYSFTGWPKNSALKLPL